MGSKSKSSSATTYQNTDKRVIADGGGFGLSGDGNAISTSSTSYTTVNALDGGAIKESADVVRAALQTISKADATAGEGFKESADVVRAALQTISKADATAGEGFETMLRTASDSFGRLVNLAGDVLGGGATALERSQELTAQAYRESVETRQATIDNKTIATIAIAGAAAFVGYGMMKK